MVNDPDSRSEGSFQFMPESRSTTATRNPVSIALLFYIVTLSAILAACFRTLISNPMITGRALATVLVLGVILGFCSGVVAGFYYFKGRFATVVASCIGIMIGAAVGTLTLVDGQHFFELSSLAFVGSWILIVFMLIAARASTVS